MMDRNPGAEGGCACGAVRFRLTRAPMLIHCCHCTQCQRLTGSAFALNAIIEMEAITILRGDIGATPGPSSEGSSHDIYRCTTCQGSVWADYGGRPNYRFVRVGAMDDPGAFPPDVHIFVRSKVPWLRLPPDVPAYEDFYQMEEVWSPQMLARRRAAIGS